MRLTLKAWTASGAKASASSSSASVFVVIKLCRVLGAAGRLGDFDQTAQDFIGVGGGVARQPCRGRREPRAEHAQTHGANIERIAVFFEKALLLVIEKSEGSGMHRERRALVRWRRFDPVRNRNPCGDGRPLRQHEPRDFAGRFVANATARDKPCAHPERVEILRRFRLGAAESAAHDLVSSKRRRALRDGLCFRDGKKDRRAMPCHGNGADRLGQPLRAGHADRENRVDFLALDRPRDVRDARARPA